MNLAIKGKFYKGIIGKLPFQMDCVISELCYKGTILQRIYMKMTISNGLFYESSY